MNFENCENKTGLQFKIFMEGTKVTLRPISYTSNFGGLR